MTLVGLHVDALDDLAKSTLPEVLRDFVPSSVGWLYDLILAQKKLSVWSLVYFWPILLDMVQNFAACLLIIGNVRIIFFDVPRHFKQAIARLLVNFGLVLEYWLLGKNWVIHLFLVWFECAAVLVEAEWLQMNSLLYASRGIFLLFFWWTEHFFLVELLLH